MRFIVVFALCCVVAFSAKAAEIKVAVTTSFHNSGLSDILLPEIQAETGLVVQLIIVGTGQALRLGRSGDVDAILVHSKVAEEEFVAKGFGTHRREIMYNDFVIIGPNDDPAKANQAETVTKVMGSIASSQSLFISRGDDSGTHRKELTLWTSAALDPETFEANWYRAVGAGMGAALNTASGMNAYIMSDRASWLKFKNKGELALLFAGDPTLFNQYAFLPVNPNKHPHVKNDLAVSLENWLVSDKGQKLIGDYMIDGEVLFTPNAKAQ